MGIIGKWAKKSSRIGWGVHAHEPLKLRSGRVNPIWVGGIGAGQNLLPRDSIKGKVPDLAEIRDSEGHLFECRGNRLRPCP